jgi:pyrimidine-nucleoside phosphorylase
VEFSTNEFKNILSETGVCLAGQTPELVPADKKMYALRDVTATIQSIPMITGSIMSKKLAEGADAFVFDIKTGRGAFMESMEQAENLAGKLMEVGNVFKKPVISFITDMNEPLGRSVGNWLEILECRELLLGKGDPRLLELTLRLCASMIYLGGKSSSPENGYETAKKKITSGEAWKKFLEMVMAQGGDTKFLLNEKNYPKSKFQVEIHAHTDGYIAGINALEAGIVSVALGAGREKSDDSIDPKAGISFYKKTGDPVRENDLLAVFYTDKKQVLDEISTKLSQAITISKTHVNPYPVIYKMLKNKLVI